jgi:hypothetical protein
MMTKKQKVIHLLHDTACAQRDVNMFKGFAAGAEKQLTRTKQQGRDALFELYVSSSHRSFVKFLREHS